MEKPSLTKIAQKPNGKKPEGNGTKTFLATLTGALLVGLIGYEVIYQNEPKHDFKSPLQEFKIPHYDPQNEHLQIQLNHSLQKLNELKRLLFVKNNAPENSAFADLKIINEEKENTIKNLKEEIALLEETLAEEENKKLQLLSKLKEGEETLQSVTLKNDSFNEKFNELNDLLVALKNENSKQKTLIDGKEFEILKLQYLVKEEEDRPSKSLLESKENEIQSLNVQLEALKDHLFNERLAFDEALRQSKPQSLDLEHNDNFRNLRRALDEKELALAEKDEALQKLKDEFQNLIPSQEKHLSLKENSSETPDSESHKREEDLLNELNEKKGEIAKLQEEIKKASNQNEFLASLTAEKKALQIRIDMLEEKLAETESESIPSLQKTIKDKDLAIASLKKELSSKDLLERTIFAVNEEKTKLEKRLAQIDKGLTEDEKEELDFLRQELKEKEIAYNTLQDQLLAKTALDLNYSTFYQGKQSSNKDSLLLKEKLNFVENVKIPELKREIAQKDLIHKRLLKELSAFDGIQENLSILLIEKQNLSERLSQLEGQHLEDEINNLREALAEKELELNRVSNRIPNVEELEKKISFLIQEKAASDKRVLGLQEKLAAAEGVALPQLRKNLAKKEETLASLQKELLSVDQLKSQLRNLSSEKQELENRLSFLESQHLDSEVYSLKDQLVVKEAELNALKDQINNSDELEKKITYLTQEKNALVKSLATLQDKLTKIESETLPSLKKAISEKDEALALLQNEVHSIDNLKENLLTLSNEKQSLENQITPIEGRSEEVNYLKNALAEKEELLEKLNQELVSVQDLQEKVSFLSREKTSLENKLVELEEKLAETESEELPGLRKALSQKGKVLQALKKEQATNLSLKKSISAIESEKETLQNRLNALEEKLAESSGVDVLELRKTLAEKEKELEELHKEIFQAKEKEYLTREELEGKVKALTVALEEISSDPVPEPIKEIPSEPAPESVKESGNEEAVILTDRQPRREKRRDDVPRTKRRKAAAINQANQVAEKEETKDPQTLPTSEEQ